MNLPLNVITHPANRPCVRPTHLINRDLSKVDRILSEFRQVVLKPGFKPAFQLAVSPTAIVYELQLRIDMPWQIDQGGASLCGPAAFMYCLAKDRPELYAQYVCDLYIFGKARINDLVVEPSNACKAGRISNSRNEATRSISAVDWIALASLRDSTNRFLRNRSVSSDSAGITLPRALSEWFSAAGYRQVQHETRLTNSPGSEHLLHAAQRYQHNQNVCLFIAAKVKSGPFTLRVVPNHWVVMSDALRLRPESKGQSLPVAASDKIPSLKVYHWRQEKDQLNPKNLNLADFSRFYFGYVAAS